MKDSVVLPLFAPPPLDPPHALSRPAAATPPAAEPRAPRNRRRVRPGAATYPEPGRTTMVAPRNRFLMDAGTLGRSGTSVNGEPWTDPRNCDKLPPRHSS